MRYKNLLFVLLGLICLGIAGANAGRPTFPVAAPGADEDDKGGAKSQPTADEAAIRMLTKAFEKAAEAGDAKAAAALWTETGEFTDTEGAVVRGRPALEKMYAEMLKDGSKGKIEIRIDSIRLLGKNLATSEGTIHASSADSKEAQVVRFEALHAREGGGWLTASVREWVPHATELVKLADLGWLIGDWEGRRDDGVVHTSYTWGDDRAFIQCRFRVTDKGKVIASGTEIIAKDPASGELRGWLFDRSGAVGESVWSRDGNRWQIQATGTVPPGVEVSAVNVMVPNGKDSFSWQPVERSVGGQPVAIGPPLKVTRIKK